MKEETLGRLYADGNYYSCDEDYPDYMDDFMLITTHTTISMLVPVIGETMAKELYRYINTGE